MRNATIRLTLIEFVASGLLAGCAWDNSAPPYHSVISYDPSRAQSYVSTVPSTNTPSTSDWKTNQVVGGGYGTTGPTTTAIPAQPIGGAVSTPSGVSSGTAAGTGAPAAPAARGTIIGSPQATGISPSPSATPTSSPINTSAGVTIPQPGAGLNPFSISSPQNSSLGTQPGMNATNTGSSLLYTNRFPLLTNSFSPGGPTP
jgi:hypothetical protein